MDVLLTQQLGKMVVEKFADAKTTTVTAATAPAATKKETGTGSSTASLAATIIGWVIVGLFGLWAGYLSWQANTLVNWNIFAKAIFALFAALNGIGYLITYLIFKWDLVLELTKLKGPVNLMGSVASVVGGGRRR